MPLATRLTDRLDIRHPILLAPMALVAGGALAGAVSAVGGLGIIGGGYGDAEWIERQFAAAGNHRVGCGFITWSMAQRPEVLDAALAHRPAAIMLSFGDPRPFAARIRQAGARLICQVQSLAHVEEAIGAGADIIIAQGAEAGGHGASRATLPFVPVVVDAVARRAPETVVVAAGGIADGRGLAAALALGASGALIGTRFLATAEALIDPVEQKAIIDAGGEDTERDAVLDIARGSRWPREYTARTLHHPFHDTWRDREDELDANAEAKAAYRRGVTSGELPPVVWASQAIDLITSLRPAADVVDGIAAQAQDALARALGR